ncbi:cytidine deaminase [Aridibaculum aurantiacum]|uniref:cytidine deaminase n=1 Tax=Aridibaculum aurantiacum TaxID=2810307 RepID=UPI001A966AF1|nr:cytidine deaminase [Aridibaculum aurantiacum]
MKKQDYTFNFEVYDTINDLKEEDKWLLNEAREVTHHAYAPYSNFQVGAIARLNNGEIVAGSNQENASFPVGLCAERVLLAAASSLFPKVPIDTLAISYHNEKGDSDHPISPCGICRQSLVEYESRVGHPIRLILGGMEGKVFVIEKAEMLLPLSFTSKDMK